MARFDSPEDMKGLTCELASCITTTSSTSVLAMPSYLQSITPVDSGKEVEAMVILQTNLKREFEVLEQNNGWAQAFFELADSCQEHPCWVARTLENRSLNHYKDINPYDHSRVHLKVAIPAPRGGFYPGLGWALAMASDTSLFSSSCFNVGRRHRSGDMNNYINASFVEVEKAQRNYILTQGPTPNTHSHFWLMVWQQNSKAVIMLNQLVEKDSNQCFQYWPTNQCQPLIFQEIGLKVHMLREEVTFHHTVRYLTLENIMTGEYKPIFHFHYTSWPNSGVPESPASFLTFLFMVRNSGYLNFEPGPVIIHCNTGIGCSGTFSLINACLVLMEKRENLFSLNIRQVLMNMREYRKGLIQTPEQLRFSYMAVIEGAKCLMGGEMVKKKYGEFTSVGQNPRYDHDDLQFHRFREYRLVSDESKIKITPGFSGLATTSTSAEGSSENSLKRLREEKEVLQDTEMEQEIEFKRTRLNP